MASVAGILAAPGLSAYSASKYALEAFSDSLRRESAPWRLRVCLIEPSFLNTAILAGVEDKANAQWGALSAPTRARWGDAFFQGSLKRSKGIVRRAEDPRLAVEELLRAVCDFEPAERYRAGTAGKYVLPLIAALPAWAADPLVAGYGVGARPAGLDAREGPPLEGSGDALPPPAGKPKQKPPPPAPQQREGKKLDAAQAATAGGAAPE